MNVSQPASKKIKFSPRVGRSKIVRYPPEELIFSREQAASALDMTCEQVGDLLELGYLKPGQGGIVLASVWAYRRFIGLSY